MNTRIVVIRKRILVVLCDMYEKMRNKAKWILQEFESYVVSDECNYRRDDTSPNDIREDKCYWSIFECSPISEVIGHIGDTSKERTIEDC